MNPRPDQKGLSVLYGADVTALSANQLYSIDIDNPVIPSKNKGKEAAMTDNDDEDQAYALSSFFGEANVSIGAILRDVKEILLAMSTLMGRPVHTRALGHRMSRETTIALLGATSHEFPYTPQNNGRRPSYDPATYKLALCAYFEATWAEKKRPDLLDPESAGGTRYLKKIRANIRRILSAYVEDTPAHGAAYEFFDLQVGDDSQQFIDLVTRTKSVQHVVSHLKRRQEEKEFYAKITPFVDFITQFPGVQYWDDETQQQMWDSRCLNVVELLLEVRLIHWLHHTL